MITTFEDARLLFARWKDEVAPLRVKLMSNNLVFEATGSVAEYTHATLQLNGPAWQFTVPIEGARFVFSDPREIPVAAIRDRETARYEFGLAIELPTSDRLVLLEIRQASQSEEDNGHDSEQPL